MKPIFIELTLDGLGQRISINPAQIATMRDDRTVGSRSILWMSIGGSEYHFSESKAQLLQMIDRAYREGGAK